jgi:hypothetical protein
MIENRATTLSRNDWHSAPIGAVLSAIPSAEGALRSMPRRPQCRRGASVVRHDAVINEWRISMSKSAKKRLSRPPQAQASAKSLATPGLVHPKKPDSDSKQSRVIAMLQSPAGATIAAMMKTTGWQQHSVRGFLAGVVRKRLKLKLGSKKVDGTRVYQIAGVESRKSRSKSKRASS